MTARIILLVTSPRLPAGLMTANAWDTVRAYPVLAGSPDGPADAVRRAGITVTVPDGSPVEALLAAAGAIGSAGSAGVDASAGVDGAAVWLAAPGGDESLARELGLRLARQPGLADLELMYGSWDPPGARVLDAVAVLDRLVSPGGDPWLREHVALPGEHSQAHRSLAQYLIEECYEAFDAISAGDLGALREELGDLLLQVVLHARLAEELPEGERWTVDDVAGDLVAKMIRRNPHVFGDATVGGVDDIIANWEQIKSAEKTRDSAMDGIALAQPALSLAAKVLSRAGRGGVTPLPATDPPVGLPRDSVDAIFRDESALGATLLALVAEAGRHELDAEAALRRAALGYAAAVRATEQAGS